MYKSDIEIAQENEMLPIDEIAKKAGIDEKYVEHYGIEDMIAEIADNLISKKNDINTEQMDWIFHSAACRAAIKAGDSSYEQELMEIAKTVDTNESIRYCPHGRPVRFILTKRELEKQFGRV